MQIERSNSVLVVEKGDTDPNEIIKNAPSALNYDSEETYYVKFPHRNGKISALTRNSLHNAAAEWVTHRDARTA